MKYIAIAEGGDFGYNDQDLDYRLKHDVTKNCLSQFLEQSRNGSHSAVTNLYKNIPKHSDPYVITQIRNCVKLLNLAPNRSF